MTSYKIIRIANEILDRAGRCDIEINVFVGMAEHWIDGDQRDL